jgi:hypothetical protein
MGRKGVKAGEHGCMKNRTTVERAGQGKSDT